MRDTPSETSELARRYFILDSQEGFDEEDASDRLATVALVATFVTPAAGITNGTPDGDNHPYVGLAVFDVGGGPAWRCSVSLLSPTLVLTAGHCTDGANAARVWFDEVVEGNPEYPFGGATSFEGTPYTHPDDGSPDNPFRGGNGLPAFSYRDVGVIVLSEPVPTSVVDEYVELPDVGLVDTLNNKTAIDFVGYGVEYQEKIKGSERPNHPPTTAGTGPRSGCTHRRRWFRASSCTAPNI